MAHYDPKTMTKYMYIDLELLYQCLTQHLTIFQLSIFVEKTLSTPKKTPDMLLDTDTINSLYLNTGRMECTPLVMIGTECIGTM